MSDSLPIHPVTGLRAVGIVGGRPVFPILGADQRGDEATATRLAEIDERLPAVRASLLEFAELGDLDDEQAQRFDALETELGELESEREPLARRAATIARVRDAQRTGRGVERVGGAPNVQTRTVEPYADLDRVASRSGGLAVGDLRSRALAAVDRVPEHMLDDDQRSRAETLLRNHDEHGRIARHMLLTGSDDYQRAFMSLLSGVAPYALDADASRALAVADEHRRALAEGTGGAGGYLVPFYLDPTVILTNAGSTNPFRRVSRVESISTNKWHGISSAGVTAGYLGEAVEATDNSPSLGQPEVDVVKMAAYLQASFEVTQDTNIAASVGRFLADAKDNFEATEFAVGDGAAGHVQGVITGVAANAPSVITSAGIGALAVDDVYAVSDDIPPRWAEKASWAAHRKIMSKIRQFATGTGQNTGAFWATLGMGNPPELLGAPIRQASAMASAVATGNEVLLAGDFSEYLIVDRIGMTVQYEPLVKGANNRPTGEVGWFAHWRTGAGVLVPDAFRLLKIQ